MGGEKTGEGMAEEQYSRVKTSVWWDIENCQVPKGCDSHAIAKNISSALSHTNYCGPVSISAYGDTNCIPPAVQRALSSTGIALNHVPAGVKDASDKKILVDMLFWAVDNPAPANYLLISGDRDFSNALHQLGMRRYNILLAQPFQASALLAAAAKNVWHWTSLSTGGPPMTATELSQLSSSCNIAGGASELSQSSLPLATEPIVFSATNPPVPVTLLSGKIKDRSRGKPKIDVKINPSRGATTSNVPEVHKGNSSFFPSDKLRNSDPLRKPTEEYIAEGEPVTSTGFFIPKNPSIVGNSNNRPPSRSTSFSMQSTRSNEVASVNKVKGNVPSFGPNNGQGQQFPSSYSQDNMMPLHPTFNSSMHPRSDVPRMPMVMPPIPDIGKLSVVDNVKYNPGAHNSHQDKSFKDTRAGSHEYSAEGGYNNLGSSQVNGAPAPTPESVSQTVNNISSSIGNHWGSQNQSSIDYQYCEFILRALSVLRVEKLMPTEANIAACIRQEDPRYSSMDVRKALDYSVQCGFLVEQTLGAIKLFVGRNERLWPCVNPTGNISKQYSKKRCDTLQNYLCSSAGRAAILGSQTRYEAALIVRKDCFQGVTLGDVIQLLNIAIDTKKWIVIHQSGWQPLLITLEEGKTSAINSSEVKSS